MDVGGVTWMGGRDLPGLGSPGAEHVEQGEVGPRRHHRGAGGNDPRRRRSQQLPRRNTAVSKMLPSAAARQLVKAAVHQLVKAVGH